MNGISTLFFITGCIYLCFILYLVVTAIKTRVGPLPASCANPYNFSLVIPCRNEAENLPVLLQSLKMLNHNGQLEILIIDDDSTDDTVKTLTTISDTLSLPIRCISSVYDPSVHLTRKQQALDKGIKSATYNIVVFTDADMSFLPNWLQSYSSVLQKNSALIFGHSAIRPDGTILTLLQAWILEFLFSVAAVFHYGGIAGSCMGNNMLISKESYLSSGGFTATGYSITEDRALLHLFRSKHYRVDSTIPFHPFAFTRPHATLSEYINQMLRWFRGGIAYGKNLAVITLLFSLQNISFFCILTGILTPITCGISVINFFITWIMIAVLFKKNKSPVPAVYFPIFYLILLIGTFILPLLAFVHRNVSWKGTKI